MAEKQTEQKYIKELLWKERQLKEKEQEGKRELGFEQKNVVNLIMREFENSGFHGPTEHCTPLHGWIIRYLSVRQDQDVFQRNIEIEFSVRRSTVSRTLKLMENKGLITRQSVGEDARLKKIVLTQEAILLHQRAMYFQAAIENKIVKGISQEELEAFFLVLAKIKQNLK